MDEMHSKARILAKLPALITALAEVDGRERQAVEHIGRFIRERGYIPTGKRGGGASEMTAREAANLILALDGADSAKDGPTAIDRFRSLMQSFGGTADDIREYVDSFDAQPQPLQDVADCRTFGEALETLIDGVPALVASFYQYAVEQYPLNEGASWDNRLLGAFGLGMFGVDIVFERYFATIELYTMHGSVRRIECGINFACDTVRLMDGFYGNDRPDRKVRVVIGMPTLIAVWQALNPGRDLPGVPARNVRAQDDEAE